MARKKAKRKVPLVQLDDKVDDVPTKKTKEEEFSG